MTGTFGNWIELIIQKSYVPSLWIPSILICAVNALVGFLSNIVATWAIIVLRGGLHMRPNKIKFVLC